MAPSCARKFSLGVDVGNTNIHFGLFSASDLLVDFRLSTFIPRTADEYELLISSRLNQFEVLPESVCHVVISSVVPPIEKPLHLMFEKYLCHTPIFVEAEGFPLPIAYQSREEIGADRLIDALAACHLYGHLKKALVIVDFGTATTFDVISPQGTYLGGAISPGIELSLEALFQKASKLPRIAFEKANRVIGKTTVESLHAGTFYGFVSQVEGILTLIQRELRSPIYVIGTGGLAPQIAPYCKRVHTVHSELTLWGLKIFHDYLASPKGSGKRGAP